MRYGYSFRTSGSGHNAPLEIACGALLYSCSVYSHFARRQVFEQRTKTYTF